MKAIFEVCVVFSMFTATAVGVKCWNCNSATDAGCGETIDTSLLDEWDMTECGGQCKTSTTTMTFLGTMSKTTSRSCTYWSCANSTSSFSTTTVSCCSGSFCNGGAPAGWNECYSCSGTEEGSDCPKEGYLSDPSHDDDTTFCKGQCYKKTNSLLGVTRGCQSSCYEAKTNILNVKSETKCCSSDKCNGGESTRMQVSSVMLCIVASLVVRAMFW